MSDLAGRYRLGEVIGTGGTATVYRATDLALGVERAVKVLRVDALGLEAQRARLRSEARAMARVAHLNILRVYDVGTDGEQDFVVMELAEGGSLQDRLDEHGPLPPVVACRYALQVLGALAAAHDAGVIHRDVKPQNVLLDLHGVALLADFGIALLADGRESRHTRVGVAMGSMTYMPPEQRLDARGVGVGADLYAAGATLYALLTGASPVDLFLAAPESPRWEDVPEPLREVLQRATKLVAEERFEGAREMAAAVIAAMGALPADPDAHPEDDKSWNVVKDRVLASLSLVEGADAAPSEVRRAPAPRKAALPGVDPTVHAEAVAPRPPGWRRWAALSGAFALVIAAGAWAWEADIAPRTRGGVLFPPRAPVDEAPPESPRDEPASEPVNVDAAPVEAAAATPASRPRKTTSAGAAASAPRGAVGTPVGRWTGAFDGRPATFVLSGPAGALRGTVTVTWLGKSVDNKVKGTFDAETRALELEDIERAPDSGRYVARLTDEPALEGTFERPGKVVSFKLMPAN